MECTRVITHGVLLTLTLLVAACGGGGGGGEGGGASVGPTPTPTVTLLPSPPPGPSLTLNIGTPTSNPAVIPPSSTRVEVKFLSVISGTYYPELLVLDEVDASGELVLPSVALMRDDGIGGDAYRGDRTYSARLSVGSVGAAEKFYRVRADNNGSEVTSNIGRFWVSGCAPVSRPSNPEKLVVDDQTQVAFFADELLVTLAETVAPSLAAINALVADVGGQVAGCIPELRQYLIEIPDNNSAADVYAAIAQLEAKAEVIAASPNIQVLALPEGEAFACDGQQCQWYLDRIRAPQAWALAGGGDEQQAVAVIDFGVDCRHEELNCDEDLSFEDVIDHGTGVAGLIGARSGDDTNLIGVAWNTKLFPYSFLGEGGSQYKMSELITLAMAEESIKVINVSAATSLDPGGQIQTALCNVIASGRLVVAAAGNASSANNCQIENIYPARYNSTGQCANGADLASGLIVVGATDAENRLAEWEDGSLCSNTLHVDMFAPGKGIYTASSRDLYTTKDGTSFAAPLVAGSAAVLWSSQPSLSVAEIHDQLVGTSVELHESATDTRVHTSDSRIEGKSMLDLFLAVGGQDELPTPDTKPDAFAFGAQADAPLNTLIASAAVPVSGIDTAAPIDIAGGFYAIDNGPYTGAAGRIRAGQTVTVQVLSADAPDASRSATVTIGGDPATFTVTTEAADTLPGSFDFRDVYEAALSRDIVSNTLQIPGINTDTSIRIEGGRYSIDGAPATSADGTVSADQSIQLHITSADTPDTAVTAVITIGDVSDSFTVTTERADISPAPFTFAAASDVLPGTVVESATISTIEGMNTSATVNVSGGEFSIGGAPFSAAVATIRAGDTLRVRHRSNSRFGANAYTTVTVGTYSATFRSTTVSNAAPVATNVSISDSNGAPTAVGDVLTATYTYSDADGDSEGATVVQWYRGAQAIAGATALSYTVSNDDSGQSLHLEVTPVAATGIPLGTPTQSSFVTIANSAPQARDLRIVDDNGGSLMVGDTLSVTFTYQDADGDLQGSSRFRWLRNGVAISGATANTYTTEAADSGEPLRVEVTPVAASGTSTGLPVVSGAVVIGNSAPSVTAVEISGATAGTAIVGDTLTGNYVFDDVDADTEGSSLYQWYRDRTAISGATSINYSVSPADSGTNIIFEVTPVAATGTANGASAQAPGVAINALPTATALSVSDSNGGSLLVGDTLVGSYTFSDAETDAEGASTYRWLRNGSAISGATDITYTLVAADSGETLSFEVSPVAASGSVAGAAVVSSSISSVNSAPTASDVRITDPNGGSADVGETLTGSFTFDDADNDSQASSTFRWLRNGAAISGATSATYTVVTADNGQSLTFEVTPVAASGVATGSAARSLGLAINTVPVAQSVSVVDGNGGSAVVGDLLQGAYTFTDSENDSEGASTYRWLRNGVAINGATLATYTVVAADSGHSLSIEVTPVASSGSSTGAAVSSTAISISNSAPTATDVTITDNNGGTVLAGDTLTGTYTYSDVDGDAEGATRFRWLRNGMAIGGATASSYTVVSADRGLGLSFEVRPIASTGSTTGNAVESAVINVEAGDVTPDPFSFTPTVGAAWNTVIESEIVTITGVDDGSAVRIVGGEYSIDGGDYSSIASTINSGQTLRLRLTTQASSEAVSTASVTVGDVTEVFSVTTNAAESTPPSVTIVFPPETSLTSEDSVTVRIVASDASGVATVRVNGADATFDEVSESWELSIPLLTEGMYNLVASATDSQGNTTQLGNEPSVSIRKQNIFNLNSPGQIVVSPDLDSVILWQSSPRQLISVGRQSGTATTLLEYTGANIYPQQMRLDPLDSDFVYVLLQGDNPNTTDISESVPMIWRINVNPDTSFERDMDRISVIYVNPEVSSESYTFENYIPDTAYDPLGNRYFLVDQYSRQVIQVAIDSGLVNVVANLDGQPSSITYDNVNNRLLVCYQYYESRKGIDSIDLGTAYPIVPTEIFPAVSGRRCQSEIIYDDNSTNGSGIIYYQYTGSPGSTLPTSIFALDLSEDSPSPRLLVESLNTDPARIYPNEKIAFDKPNNRLITRGVISDASMLVAVDTSSGEISPFVDNPSIDSGIFNSEFTRMLQVGSAYATGGQLLEYDLTNPSNITSTIVASNIIAEEISNTYLGDIRVTYLEADFADNFAISFDWYMHNIVRLDLETGQRTVVANNSVFDANRAFLSMRSFVVDSANNRFLVTDDLRHAVIAIDMTTLARSFVSVNSASNSDNPLVGPTDLILDEAEQRLIILDRFDYTYPHSRGHLKSVNLADGSRLKLTESNLDTWGGGYISWNQDQSQILLLEDDSVGAFSYVDGDPNNLTYSSVLTNFCDLCDFDIGSDNGLLYGVAGGSGTPSVTRTLVQVDLSNSEQSPLVTLNSPNDTNSFRNPHRVIKHAAEDYMYVIDADLSAIIRVSAIDGTRTILSDDSRDDGIIFGTLQRIALDEIGGRAFVTNSTNTVFEVDLSTGERNVLSDTSIPGNEATALSVSGLYQGMVYDRVHDRLLLSRQRVSFSTDTATDYAAIIAVDPNTGVRSIFSDNDTINGVGFDSSSYMSIALDHPRNRLLVATQYSGVLAIDLDSGISSEFYGQSSSSAWYMGAYVDTNRNRAVFIKEFALVFVDLDTGIQLNRTSIHDLSGRSTWFNFVDVAPSGMGYRVDSIDVTLHGVVSIDVISGESVLLSK